ncbi:hypothetical protein QH494_02580 [Sphingomonas sp. AR_OL41]|uniref:hypothetical protein n=1 Tax=Sphingomonas sp. AR_OL41 TaxID=3042729 RepID=UPI00247FC9C3|nr:hypothetical protein [Sphingomonas sp. AR_OL41]MDH7971055.1 hypothetical protein [Sphingomonas sp. AR_OL41]
MKTISLPAYDVPGDLLSPIVLAALANGATSANHPTDSALITVSFEDDQAGTDFEAAISAILNPPAPEAPAKGGKSK